MVRSGQFIGGVWNPNTRLHERFYIKRTVLDEAAEKTAMDVTQFLKEAG